MASVTLDLLKKGEQGCVTEIDRKHPASQRLMEMGMIPGTKVELLRIAPLGDPLEFKVMGYTLCLRKSEAQAMHITKIDGSQT